MKRIIWCLLLLVSATAMAQNDFYKAEQPKPVARKYTVTLQDGTRLVGELVRQDTNEAVIKTANMGQVTVKASQIVSMVIVDTDKPAPDTYPNLFPQYLNFAPTAYSAERGKLYFRNSLLYYSQFDYGITDNWSVGAGFLTFLPSLLYSVNTKLSFPAGRMVRLGVQGQYAGGSVIDGLSYGLGYVQGIATIGDSQRNVTIGVGAVFNRGELSRGKLLTVGIVRKVSPSLTFISENHISTGDGIGTTVSIAGGVRFDRRRHAFDIALHVPFNTESNVPVFLVPFASYQIRIGQ